MMTRSTAVCTVASAFSSSGAKVRSVRITRSPAWRMIQPSWSGCRRGFSVWQTAPMPITPYQTSMWRPLFHASVATRSPALIPHSASRWLTCFARRWMSA